MCLMFKAESRCLMVACFLALGLVPNLPDANAMLLG